ncbi:alpha/beta fold hydrolase [Glycocaulis sp.]|uniref:alpha/beta fold hydrolase n=1 Tax=Glycocaulis sp. TaxID=1969725 RepID=UPI003F7256EF
MKMSLLTLGLTIMLFGTAASLEPPADPYSEARELIADIQHIATPDGIEEQRTVTLGGLEQWITIRGTDRTNPVLLYIHGGPGATMMPVSWTFQRGWEDYFTVVQWDQRGAGRTARTNPVEAVAGTLSLDQVASDAVELIAWLRAHLGVDQVIVAGHSWGTLVGLSAVHQVPEQVSAYVAIGPVVSIPANEAAGYAMLLEEARARNDAEALAELEALAPYPGDLTFERLGVQRSWVGRYGGLAAYRDNARHFFRAPRLSPDYDREDVAEINPATLRIFDEMFDDFAGIDLTGISRLDVPVVLFLGRHDINTPTGPVLDWFNTLEAPHKQVVWFEHSAHLMPVEEPGKTLIELVNTVRPLVVAD